MSSVKICMTVLLVINTWTDIRKKEICLPVLFIFLAGGILWRIRQGLLWPAGIISMGIGVFIILIALISGGMVGFGDGLLILTMGSVLGAGELAGILCGALLLCGIYSGNSFCTGSADRIFWRDIFVRKIKKGSFTIEAALLMPLVLMILIGVLYLDFFVHDRAYLTAAAYEAAVSGSMEGYKKKGNIYEKADIQGRMLGDIGLPGGENLSMQTNAGKTVKVTYRLEVPAGFLGQKWKLEVSGKAKPLRPVGWIRKVKGTVDMLGEVTP